MSDEAEPSDLTPIDEALTAREGELTETGGGLSRRQAAFMGVPIDVMISVGRAKPLVSELVQLRRDSVLTLDSRIDDPVELYIGERLIARGELQEMDDGSGQLGVRLTEVADLSNGV
ncbi:hypothetical protein GO499_17265 [Algicella marina]|uniref:Flagellar motor switch protein FliN n=2 Tax=Algicella marina TaxID=2683284 RepID=A0A6P1T539_9RHOB|nr:hypothetical protein GO499_17265 [Algicella marina]